jgi:Fe-S cluster assembly protein SufD
MTQTMPDVIPDTDPRLTSFTRFERDALQPKWLMNIRKSGLARFSENGFPALHDEDWKYTNVKAIAELPFKPVTELADSLPTAADLEKFHFLKTSETLLVFVDGQFASSLSKLPTAQKGVLITNLKDALTKVPELIEQKLSKLSTLDANGFTGLNTAYFEDGVFIHVAASQTVEQPVHALFISTGSEAGITANTRNLIVADASSHLTYMENYVSLGDAATFSNAVSEFFVGDNAHVEHVKFQEQDANSYHIAGLYSEVGRDARMWSHSIALGAALSRNNIRMRLNGPGLEAVLNGLYLTRGKQLADHHMFVEHAAPSCESHEYFNGILDDESRGVFHGRIFVHRVAQKTDAKQTNKNLLLSDNARANTKPQLEIYADDVKCTHGATVGQMDDKAIFYLRARGLPLEVARRMLMHAFAGEIIERVQHRTIREELDAIIWDRLEEKLQIGA